MLAKTEIRKQFRLLRDSFVTSRFEDLNRSLSIQLAPILNQGSLWIGYRSRGNEADPYWAIEKSRQKSSQRWAFPRVHGSELEFYIPHSEDAFQLSPWGILEPDPANSEAIQIGQADGVLVPGLAFDRRGGRLGTGKGFYDKALKDFRGMKVGVAFSVQISTEPLPKDCHDIPMNKVVTENEVIDVELSDEIKKGFTS